jgi:hypothetical protein
LVLHWAVSERIEEKMGKSSIELPDLPAGWNNDAANSVSDKSSDSWPDFILPDGKKLGDVIQQHRSDLRNAVDRLQNDPQSLDGGLGYAAGHYLGMAWPNGAIDFKNRFRGQGDPTDLGKAGNFAYYAIGSGILPDAVLDAGASAYNFYKSSKDSKAKQASSAAKMKQNNNAIFSPDASAQSVRDHALAYGARFK